MKCPKCGCTQVAKYGSRITQKGRVQRYQCQKCAYVFNEEATD